MKPRCEMTPQLQSLKKIERELVIALDRCEWVHHHAPPNARESWDVAGLTDALRLIRHIIDTHTSAPDGIRTCA